MPIIRSSKVIFSASPGLVGSRSGGGRCPAGFTAGAATLAGDSTGVPPLVANAVAEASFGVDSAVAVSVEAGSVTPVDVADFSSDATAGVEIPGLAADSCPQPSETRAIAPKSMAAIITAHCGRLHFMERHRPAGESNSDLAKSWHQQHSAVRHPSH